MSNSVLEADPASLLDGSNSNSGLPRNSTEESNDAQASTSARPACKDSGLMQLAGLYSPLKPPPTIAHSGIPPADANTETLQRELSANLRPGSNSASQDASTSGSAHSARRPRPKPLSLSPTASQLSGPQTTPQTQTQTQRQIAKFPLEFVETPVATTELLSPTLDSDDELVDPGLLGSEVTSRTKGQAALAQLSQRSRAMHPTYEDTKRANDPSTPSRLNLKPIAFNSPHIVKHEVISIHSSPASSPLPSPSQLFPNAFSQHQNVSSSKSKKRKQEGSQDTAQPPKKKPKSETVRRKSETHWVLDGNVVIAIDKVAFRLHRSTLVKHSSYFRDDVFGEREHQDGVEGSDSLGNDLPLYIIKEDNVTAMNFSALLSAMDDAITYVHTEPEQGTVIDVLEVAHALGFTHFYNWAIAILEKTWSSSIDTLGTAIPGALNIAILARKCAITSIQKRALYETYRDDRTWLESRGQVAPNAIDRINWPHKFYIIDGLKDIQNELRAAWLGQAFEPMYVPCATSSCTSVSSPVMHATIVKESAIQHDYSHDPMGSFEALIGLDWKGKGYCDVCIEERKKSWMSTREKVWAGFAAELMARL